MATTMNKRKVFSIKGKVSDMTNTIWKNKTKIITAFEQDRLKIM
jgi:hypothetical protein